MAKKAQLRELRENTIINLKSKREDKQCEKVVELVMRELRKEFKVNIVNEKKILLVNVVKHLRKNFPSVEFADPEVAKSFMSPDGGITYLVDKSGNYYPILIAEVKNQGTNDARKKEGKSKQAKGNAIERLGKNVIGFRTYMLNEGIFPFVCFGDGCDFEKGSTILDRVSTIAMFGKLNTDSTMNLGPNGMFNRGSYYFKDEYWTAGEMYDVLLEVARKSIYYYFAKYGDNNFIRK